MPEGDTIHRAARVLHAALAGQTLTAYVGHTPKTAAIDLVGVGVERVEARGKNLLVHFGDRRVLWGHLLMTGAWHVYRHGEAWKKPADGARVVLETADVVVVCFYAELVELLPPGGELRHPLLRTLGPDILAPALDEDGILARMRGQHFVPIGVTLLDQRVVAGIGNVYKSEVLFLEAQDPFVTTGALAEPRRLELVRATRVLMQKNLDGLPRRTRGSTVREHYWVYGRSGEACARCGTPIAMRRQGDMGRSTYFCSRCQHVARPAR
jgi:endonuclease-8